MQFVSPVSGELVEIVRGARRRILSLKILADKTQEYVQHKPLDLAAADAETIKAFLLQSGAWPFVKQRPYDIIANPDATPKAIFVSGYTTAPLAAEADFVLSGKEDQLQAAIKTLGKLTPGPNPCFRGKIGKFPVSTTGWSDRS